MRRRAGGRMSLTASSCCSDSPEEGHHALASAELATVAGDRRGRVALALERIPSLVDVDRLLVDEAWS